MQPSSANTQDWPSVEDLHTEGSVWGHVQVWTPQASNDASFSVTTPDALPEASALV